MNKIAIINRGVPGSGKSTFTKTMQKLADKNGLSMAIHSTDDKHMVEGEYKWDMKLVGQYHKENLDEFTNSLASGVNVVLCDNTNVRQRDFAKYLKVAKESGYTVTAVTFAPDEVEKHIARNTHNVPEETIILMRTRLSLNLITDMFDREVVIYPDKYSDTKLLTVAESIIQRG